MGGGGGERLSEIARRLVLKCGESGGGGGDGERCKGQRRVGAE